MTDPSGRDADNRLEAEALAKSYKRRVVVKSVSMHVNGGEIVGLLGPNGAGKTTCFYMIVGLVENDSGSIRLNRKTISHLPMHQRARLGIGYLPQEASVFRNLTVEQNIFAILQLRKDIDRPTRQQMLESLLEDFQIEHLRNSDGISLSGGERRRVEIARALANQPDFILLDEPFAGVDPISVIDIQSIIRQLAERGIGVLILHPGWVRTRMGGERAPLSPTESVTGMRRLIDRFRQENSGHFYRYDGTEIPW